MKPTITRSGDRIIAVKFQATWPDPVKQYRSILNEMPNDRAKETWMKSTVELQLAGDMCEVRLV